MTARNICIYLPYNIVYKVVQLVEALRYKPEGRGFDSWWQFFRPHCGPGVDSASNRNEYQEYFLGGKGSQCVGLTTLPPSCADCLEILGASKSWNPQACTGTACLITQNVTSAYPPTSKLQISQNKSFAELKYRKPNHNIRNRCLIQKKCHKTRFSTVVRWRYQLCHYHSQLKANYILRRQTWIEKLCILMRYDDPRATNLLELTKPLATTRCVQSIVPGLLARPLRIRARHGM
jgi:hypothetical protein